MENSEDSYESYVQARLEQKKEIQKQIRQAFALVEHPGEHNLFVDGRAAAAGQYVEKALRGRRWQDLPGNTIHENAVDLHKFSPAAFRYYLPAWLLEAMEDVEGDMVPPVLLSTLTPPPYSPVGIEEKWFTICIEPLTLEQKRAVLAYFEYTNEGYDNPESTYVQTLTHYWRQFA